MSLTRRRFIEAASLTVLASTVRPIAFAQSVSGLKDDTFSSENLAVLDDVSEETFKPLIGEKFKVIQGKRQLESVTLLSVSAAAQPSTASRLPNAYRLSKDSRQAAEGFSLRFRGSGKSLTQGTYTLKNESLGSVALFIVPCGPGTNPQTYTATFNLLMP
jgi:hypothetical protein